MMAKFFLPALLALVLTSPDYTTALQKPHPKVNAVEVSSPVPVVFGEKDDGLPERLKARGTISKVSLSRACGVVFWSGTLEITLRGKIKGYPHSKLYLVVNCLEGNDEKKYLGREVEVSASKLYAEYSDVRDASTFYFEAIDNTIDSGGITFYCTTLSVDDILKATVHH